MDLPHEALHFQHFARASPTAKVLGSQRLMAHVVLRLCQVALVSAALAGCKSKSTRGELSPPDDAPAWEERYGVAFDDDYTSADPQLGGRASHDVFDQQLFAERLGYAAIIVLARVEQVWGRGRHRGHKMSLRRRVFAHKSQI